jgi:hypothetical protein
MWTPEKVEKLRSWAAEGMSSGDMAKLLGGGETRNSVSGKCAREGIRLAGVMGKRGNGVLPMKKLNPAKGGVKPGTRFVSRFTGHPPVSKTAVPRERYVCSEAVAVAVLDVKGCRWPVGDVKDDDFRFCNEGMERGSSYCWNHLGKSLNRPLTR